MRRSVWLGLGIAVVLIFAALSTDKLAIIPTAPADGATIYEREPTFTWIGPADIILIDDNPSFTSPVQINVTGLRRYTHTGELGLSMQYWRLEGERQSAIRMFAIEGKASLEVENSPDGARIKNKGNVDLIVNSTNGITGAIILPRKATRLLPNNPDAVEGRADE